MKKFLYLIILSILMTGCTSQHSQEQLENLKGECKITNVSDVSISQDVVKIECKDNTVYRCFRYGYTYNGVGIDCIEVKNGN